MPKTRGFSSMIEKEHVISILKDANEAVRTENTLLLNELSNKTLHSSSIYQDPDSIALAVTMYVLGKIFSNPAFKSYDKWNIFVKKTAMCLSKASRAVQKDNLLEFRKEMIRIRQDMKLFGGLKDSIKEVFRKASINKASKIYEHGISRAETADLLGITEWELASYATSQFITDNDLLLTKSVRERIKFMEDMFR